VVMNNLAKNISGARTNTEPLSSWMIQSNNFTPTNVADYLDDPSNDDFRPINDASIVNAGDVTYTNSEFSPTGVDSLTRDVGAMIYNGIQWDAGITWSVGSRFNFFG